MTAIIVYQANFCKEYCIIIYVWKLDLRFAAIWMLKKTFHIKDRIQHQSLRTWKNTFLREKYDTNYVTTAKWIWKTRTYFFTFFKKDCK